MATHSYTLAWKIPWTEEPGRLQSMGSLRVGHDWATSLSRIGEGNGNHSSVLAWRVPGKGEPCGLPSMGSHRVGHDWSDLAAAAEEENYVYMHVCVYIYMYITWYILIFFHIVLYTRLDVHYLKTGTLHGFYKLKNLNSILRMTKIDRMIKKF